MSSGVELRCDANPTKLLAKVHRPTIVDGNLIEIACEDCKKRYRRNGDHVARVLHRFDVEGNLIESEAQR